ncbi:unnamed protein product, partial [Choristocarpus tenellus]
TVVDGGVGYDGSAKPPAVTIEKPPFSDDVARASVVLKRTGRVFRAVLKTSGKGYTSRPEVVISPPR